MGKKKGGGKSKGVVLSLEDLQAQSSTPVTSTVLPSAPSLGLAQRSLASEGKGNEGGGWGRNTSIGGGGGGRDGPVGRYNRDNTNAPGKEKVLTEADEAGNWRGVGGGKLFGEDAPKKSRGRNHGHPNDEQTIWTKSELPPTPSHRNNGGESNRRFAQDHKMGMKETDVDKNNDWRKAAPQPANDSFQQNSNGNKNQRSNFGNRYFQNVSEKEPKKWSSGQTLPPPPTNTGTTNTESNNSNNSTTATTTPTNVSRYNKNDNNENLKSGDNNIRGDNWRLKRGGGGGETNGGDNYVPGKGGSPTRRNYNQQKERSYYQQKDGQENGVNPSTSTSTPSSRSTFKSPRTSPKSTESVSTTASTASISDAILTPIQTPEPLVSNDKNSLEESTPTSTIEVEKDTTIDNSKEASIKMNSDKEKEAVEVIEIPKQLSAKEEKALAKKLEKEKRKKEEEEKKAREAAEKAAQEAKVVEQKNKASNLFAQGLKGFPLAKAFRDLKGEFEAEPSIKNDFIVEYLLRDVVEMSDLPSGKWIEESEYGALLAALLINDTEKYNCLFAVQRYCYSINFPRLPDKSSLITILFCALLDKNFIEGDFFLMWKDDANVDFGKNKALIQTTTWLIALEQELSL